MLLRRLFAVGVLGWSCAGFALAQGTAVIEDSGDYYGPSSGIFFVLSAVNGIELPDNAARSSLKASFGRGAYLKVVEHSRPVAAGAATLRLRGAIENVSAIQAIYRAMFQGGSPEFSGEVQVDLQPGRRYRVTGILDSMRREAWLEDTETKQMVGSKVVMPTDPALLKAMEGAQFLCCNLRYEDNWADDTAWPHLPFIPAGSRIKVVEFKRNEAAVLIDGRRLRIGNAYSREQESIQQMMARLAVDADPRDKLASYAEPVRNAIKSGKVVPGMTREQVLMAVGRPRPADTRQLDEREWKYPMASGDEVFLVFDEQGRLKEVDGSRKARGFLMVPPTQAPASPAPAAAASAPR